MRWLLLVFLLVAAGGAPAAIGDPRDQLPDPRAEELARSIGRELRCMVCQNQSIEDSDADLARDLRRIVREQVAAGRSADQVMEFVHARYGDFVLLRPPVKPATLLLWATPLIAVAGGLLLVRSLRRRLRAAPAPVALTPAEQAQLDRIEGGRGA